MLWEHYLHWWESRMFLQQAYYKNSFFSVKDRLKPIPVDVFSEHVKSMHTERDQWFELEYGVSLGLAKLSDLKIGCAYKNSFLQAIESQIMKWPWSLKTKSATVLEIFFHVRDTQAMAKLTPLLPSQMISTECFWRRCQGGSILTTLMPAMLMYIE